jgi:hypothetical protein
MIQVPFQQWLSLHSLLGGDWRFFWPENIGNFANFPLSWDTSLNTGIGSSAFSSIWINTYLNFTAFISNLGLPWSLVGLLFWILPVFFLSFTSSFLLYRYIFPGSKFSGVLAGIIYASNTYILMILSGGQLGVSLAYSLVPLVLCMFMKAINDLNYKTTILFSLVLALEVLFDPRIAYLTGTAILVYVFFKRSSFGKFYKEIYFAFFIPAVMVILTHSYWIFPIFFFHIIPVPIGFYSVEGLRFFSFADFSHSLSLLHPNWPENIFGKIYFMKSEFLLLPIMAFSSLLFLGLRRRIVLFFTALALLGAFLAKGTNPPFGEIYVWFFNNFPGFVAFRDPTKWYILVAVSYSVLVPFSMFSMGKKLQNYFNSKIRLGIFFLTVLTYVLFITLWIFLIFPGVLGQLGKNFKIITVPKEYLTLKDFLSKDKYFYRTLWIPAWQRFGYFSNLHPAISASDFFKVNSSKENIDLLKKSETSKLLLESSVKYVVVPYDSLGEFFLKDRECDDGQFNYLVKEIGGVKWLKKIRAFEKIAVFEIYPSAGGFKDHFWSPDSDLKINYKYINPTKYEVHVESAREGDVLVFSEGFDKNWQAKTVDYSANSTSYDKVFNSFVLEKDGNYTLDVYYEPQKWVNIGLWISGITLVITVSFLSFGYISKKW